MKTIAISIQKGGTGKTTLTFHLIQRLLEKGKSILAIDIDMQGNLTNLLINEEDLPDESHIKSIYEKNLETKPYYVSKNLYLLGSDIELSRYEAFSDLKFLNALRKYIASIKNKVDYVIIDTPPALSMFTASALLATDYVLIPLDTSKHSIKSLDIFEDMLPSINDLRNSELKILGVILSRVKKSNYMKSIEDYLKERYREKYLGKIRDSVKVQEALANKIPVWKYASKSNVSYDYIEVMENIIKNLEEVSA